MELLYFLIFMLAVTRLVNVLSPSKKGTRTRGDEVETRALTDVKAKENKQAIKNSESICAAKASLDLRTNSREVPESLTEGNSQPDQADDFLIDNEFCRALESISAFPATEVFESISSSERVLIAEQFAKNNGAREGERRFRLQLADSDKQKVINELDAIEFAIAENDSWFLQAQSNNVKFSSGALHQHKLKAAELYNRKKEIIETRLPEADLKIKASVSEIEFEEKNEALHQRRDMERLLRPYHEKNEHSRRLIIAARTPELVRQREKSDALAQIEEQLLQNRSRIERQLVQNRSRIERQLVQNRSRMEGIRARVEARNIPYVVHFTPMTNVDSIVKAGLLSRNCLNGKSFIYTDERRADGWLDWISTSISFPNYRMFFSKQNNLQHVHAWAVVLLRREVLWELECKYIITNAARSEIRAYDPHWWSSQSAFDNMFGSLEHRANIPEHFTTDPQAEVMIRNRIPTRYIKGIAVKNSYERKKLGRVGGALVEVVPDLFGPRCDFERWREFSLNPFSENNTRTLVE